MWEGGDGDTRGQVRHHQVTEQLDEGDQATVEQSKKDQLRETDQVIEKQGESLRGDQDSRKQDRNLHEHQQDGNDHEVLNQQRSSQPKMSQQRTQKHGGRDHQDTGTGNRDTGQEAGLEDQDTKEGDQGNQERDQGTEEKDRDGEKEECAANNPSDCSSPDPFPPEEDEPNYGMCVLSDIHIHASMVDTHTPKIQGLSLNTLP